MMDVTLFSQIEERQTMLAEVSKNVGQPLTAETIEFLGKALMRAREANLAAIEQERLLRGVETAIVVASEVSIGSQVTLAKVMYEYGALSIVSDEEIQRVMPLGTMELISGLHKVDDLYTKSQSVENENFRKLLMSLAEDIRVIIILICEVLHLTRLATRQDTPLTRDHAESVARQASYLFAPLAHRLGLYRIKSELEDLSMKALHYDIYKEIASKLNETKKSRDAYIERFITPLKQKLAAAGLRCTVKGRTKSIYSIWNKIKKQNTTFEHVYDLFAIRVILDSELEHEKADCWQVYSIVTDEYKPNPKRLRDWISLPKQNGYESLHTTVMGPEGKWVEVQIRTERMDEIAEKGFAAHFKYKGVRSESGLDSWLANIREILENPEAAADECMSEFKMNLYDKEVFVFTPTGDLLSLPVGATVLDFAYQIHTGLGHKCVGGRIAGKNVPIRYEVSNGDQLEILTAPNQKPKEEWLQIAKTSKAKTRIKAFLRDEENANAGIGRELLSRRFKNWKIDLDESLVSKLVKKLGYKMISHFYRDLGLDRLDIARVKSAYLEIQQHEQNPGMDYEQRSAEEYELNPQKADSKESDDVLTIDEGLKGVQYTLAKCCNPIYGDDVFGFILASGGIKIHRNDCPNAPQMMSRFGYRYVKAKWSGKSGTKYVCTLRVVGNDDLGIVTNITSILQKEPQVTLRSISVDSQSGLFQGHISLNVSSLSQLDAIVKKIITIKGVKQVERA